MDYLLGGYIALLLATAILAKWRNILINEIPKATLHEVKSGIFSNITAAVMFFFGVFLALWMYYLSPEGGTPDMKILVISMVVFTVLAACYWLWIAERYYKGRRKQGKFANPQVSISTDGKNRTVQLHFETELSKKEAIRECIAALEKEL